MAIHWGGCTLGEHLDVQACRDKSMNILGSPMDCKEGCEIGEHELGVACFPVIIPGRPPRPIPDVKTTRMEVEIPALPTVPPERLRLGPQPTGPGPYHATVRGPGGFAVNVSGDGDLFGLVLSTIGDAIRSFVGD